MYLPLDNTLPLSHTLYMDLTKFAPGTKVQITSAHWDRSAHGRVGTVHSAELVTETDGPTPAGVWSHYVKLAATETASARGQWVAGDELVAR